MFRRLVSVSVGLKVELTDHTDANHIVRGDKAINNKNTVFKRLVASTLAWLMVVSQILIPVSAEPIILAQSTTPSWSAEIDIDPPVIDHEALESGVPGEPQTFNAIVVDDRGLQHVMLFYRDRTGVQYQSVAMDRTADSSAYSATIETSSTQQRIEYYIEALDTGGNRVLKGFPFFPLVRQLVAPPVETPVTTSEPAETQSKALYVLLGLAAVGLVVALVSGGGDDSNPETPPVEPQPDTVPLNIIVNQP